MSFTKRKPLYKRKKFITGLGDSLQKHSVTVLITYTLSIFISAYTLVQSRVETEKSITNQYKIKLDLLEKDMSQIKLENEQYKTWLLENEKINPTLYEKFQKLNAENAELRREKKEINPNISNEQDNEKKLTQIPLFKKYMIRKGASFYDEQANILVGVGNVDVTRSAEIVVNTFSPKEEEKLKVSPGSAIQLNNGDYVLLVTDVEFITDQVSFILKANK
ncbi:hypothetical protein [Enterobacter ludwigii]|uniref:hypothetical protein n=1 Tax=Enterobacter ludwigii TaxID=299767 RepID=UPI002ACA21CB|nr:hypothetical protein [Enterobacter ludwigii]MDZ5700949.1 hypothetical protein [Enterobacter ludwigii]